MKTRRINAPKGLAKITYQNNLPRQLAEFKCDSNPRILLARNKSDSSSRYWLARENPTPLLRIPKQDPARHPSPPPPAAPCNGGGGRGWESLRLFHPQRTYLYKRWNRVSVSAHSAGAYTATLLVKVCKCNERGWACTPHSHQPSLILPSWLNVRQKADVTTLCTLWFHPTTTELGGGRGRGGTRERRWGRGGRGSMCCRLFELPPLWEKLWGRYTWIPHTHLFWAIAIIITLVIRSSLKDWSRWKKCTLARHKGQLL